MASLSPYLLDHVYVEYTYLWKNIAEKLSYWTYIYVSLNVDVISVTLVSVLDSQS